MRLKKIRGDPSAFNADQLNQRDSQAGQTLICGIGI